MIQVLRFTIVSAGGAVIDIAIAYWLASHFGAPLWFAAGSGFMVAALGNYVVHELWTFRRNKSPRLSGRRAISYLATAGVVLMSRLAAVALLGSWQPKEHLIAILFGSVVISFFVNYFLSKFLLFSQSSEGKSISL